MKQSWTARYGGKCLLDSWADMTSPRFGGPWTERKLQILQAYLDSYTTALKNQPFALTYVDGFAGAGSYRESGADYDEFDEFRQGSTRIALAIDDKPFDRFVFIEKEVGAAEALLTLASEFQGRQIEVVQGDANIEVPQFCHNMSDFDRAVVFLDPYATEVSWETVKAIAESGKIDCWIYLVVVIRTEAAEAGAYEVNFSVSDSRGSLPSPPPRSIHSTPSPQGRHSYISIVADLGLQLRHSGRHNIRILINGQELHRLEFQIEER